MVGERNAYGANKFFQYYTGLPKSTLEKLYKFYQIDFELFGYEVPDRLWEMAEDVQIVTALCFHLLANMYLLINKFLRRSNGIFILTRKEVIISVKHIIQKYTCKYTLRWDPLPHGGP